jgi:hypothetical protein
VIRRWLRRPDRKDVAVAATDQVADSSRPAGLMGGAEADPVVAVEVLAEDDVVFPCRIGLQAFDLPEAGSAAVWVGKEDRDQPVFQVMPDGIQRQAVSRAGWVLNREIVPEELVVALKGLDD